MAVPIATAPAPTQLICRYPKRKRAAVSYNEIDSPDDDLFISDDEDIDDDFGARRNKKRKTAAKREPRQKPFPLLSLPPELRIRIYQEALTSPNGIYVCNARKGLRRSCCGTTDVESWDRPIANLLATSKAVYAETATMLYGQRFRFKDNRTLLTFLSLMRPQTTALLRDVVIAEWNCGRTFSSMNVPAMALLSHSGAHLRRLRIETDLLASRHYCYWRRGKGQSFEVLLARKVFRDCYPLLYAIQAQRGLAAVLDVVDLDDVNFDSSKQRQRTWERAWPDTADVQGGSDSDKMAYRRRGFQKKLAQLLDGDAAEVEDDWESSDAQVCA